MSRKDNPDIFELEGIVKKLLPGTMFDVELSVNEQTTTMLCILAGKLKQHFIRLTVGDKVLVEVSRYDLSKGRITYRLKHKTSWETTSKNKPIRNFGPRHGRK
jgi:translation initiation factor IF-1